MFQFKFSMCSWHVYNFFEKLQIDENEKRKDRWLKSFPGTRNNDEIYIYSMDLVILYTVDDTWAASSL